jgi:catechol 2,3-dioxygenase-like lactoylglutathione lyase family enzyme
VDWKIEVVTIPVSNVESARDFYAEKLGFNVDIDETVGDGDRLVQLTPPGSACSIHLSKPGMGMETGSIDGVFLVVPDVIAARAELAERGVEVGEIQVFEGGAYGPAQEGESLDGVGCVFFEDPDGNQWTIQQIPARDDSDKQVTNG